MKKLWNNKQAKEQLIIYAVVTLAFLVMQGLSMAGVLGSAMKGFLVPVCAYIVLAVSRRAESGPCGLYGHRRLHRHPCGCCSG